MRTDVMIPGDKVEEELIRILFGGAIENGLTEIAWEDAPKLMAKLERAGLTVRGEMIENSMGDKRPYISVELKIKVKGLR